MQVAILEGEFGSKAACKLFEGQIGGGATAVAEFGSEASGVWPIECQLWLRCECRESQRDVSEWVESGGWRGEFGALDEWRAWRLWSCQPWRTGGRG